MVRSFSLYSWRLRTFGDWNIVYSDGKIRNSIFSIAITYPKESTEWSSSGDSLWRIAGISHFTWANVVIQIFTCANTKCRETLAHFEEQNKLMYDIPSQFKIFSRSLFRRLSPFLRRYVRIFTIPSSTPGLNSFSFFGSHLCCVSTTPKTKRATNNCPSCAAEELSVSSSNAMHENRELSPVKIKWRLRSRVGW